MAREGGGGGEGVDSGDIVICDEMAFMPNRMFTEVIIPLLGMKKAKLLGISTPSPDEYNFFSRMLTLKYPNSDRYVFGNLVIDLACDQCKKKDRAVDCKHMQGLIPQWKGSKKFELASQLYGEFNSVSHARESMGLMMTSDDKLFEPKHINRFDKRTLWCRKTQDCKPTHIYMGVDPNAGGPSEMAIVSVARVMNVSLIVGIDAHPVRTADKMEELLRSHCRKIREDPFLATAWIIVVYEKNTGLESGHGWKVIEEFQPAYALYQNKVEKDKAIGTPDQDPGIVTTHYLKNEYGRILGDCLRKSTLYFYCDWICSNPWLRPYDTRREVVKTSLVRQLANCRIKSPSMDPTRPRLGMNMPKLSWSGKIGADGREVYGQNDDKVMALAMALYWMHLVLQFNYPTVPYDTLFPNVPNRKAIRTYH